MTAKRPWQAIVYLTNPQTGQRWQATSYHSTRELAERRVEKYPPTHRAKQGATCAREDHAIMDTRE